MDKKQNLLDSAGFNFVSGERGSQTYGFLEYHKIRKLMYVSRL